MDKNIKLNSHGKMSLEIIIAIALLGMTLFGVYKLFGEQKKLGQSSTIEFEMTYFIDDIHDILSNPKNCTLTLGGSNPRIDPSVTEIKVFSSENKTQTRYETFELNNKVYGQNNLIIDKITLSDKAPDVDIDANLTYLIFDFRHSNSFIDSIPKKRKVKVNIVMDENKRISSCFTYPSVGGQFKQGSFTKNWSKISGTNDIFFGGGNIGIGQDPKTTLSVNGQIQIGYAENLPCNSDSEGSLRVSKLNNLLEFCNAKTNSWQLIVQSSSGAKPTEYLVEAKKNKIETFNTPEAYKLCHLGGMSLHHGECKISKLDNSSEKSIWEVKASHIKGSLTKCQALCIN